MHQRCARRRPIFEPVMLTAIDLDQLTQTRTSRARLLDLWRPQFARQPKPASYHQRSDGLYGQGHTVALPELLSRQRRAKISVTLANNPKGLVGDGSLQPVITRAIALKSDPQDLPGCNGAPV